MKKIINLSVFALITFFAKGQTTKGNWIAGGSLAFTSSHVKETGTGISGSTTSTDLQFTPDAGYFFIDNLAAGINLNLTSEHDNSQGVTSTTTLYTAGPLVRYYFNTSPRVKIFVHGDASWGAAKYTYTYTGSPEQTEPTVSVSIYDGKAGAAFFLNPSVALEFTAGYMMTGENVQGVKTTTGSVVIGLGFQVYLGPKK